MCREVTRKRQTSEMTMTILFAVLVYVALTAFLLLFFRRVKSFDEQIRTFLSGGDTKSGEADRRQAA
jgi:hypothetical protein